MSDNLATSIAALPLRAFPGARCRSARGPIIIYFCYAASVGRLLAYFATHRAMPECFWTIVFGTESVINSLVNIRVLFFSCWLTLLSNVAVKNLIAVFAGGSIELLLFICYLQLQICEYTRHQPQITAIVLRVGNMIYEFFCTSAGVIIISIIVVYAACPT